MISWGMILISDALRPTHRGHSVDTSSHLTLGLAAVRIGGGVQHHHLARLARRGLIPHSLAGRFRLVAICDFEQIRSVCIREGYLKHQPENPSHAG